VHHKTEEEHLGDAMPCREGLFSERRQRRKVGISVGVLQIEVFWLCMELRTTIRGIAC
jgi:hypothetical protein